MSTELNIPLDELEALDRCELLLCWLEWLLQDERNRTVIESIREECGDGLIRPVVDDMGQPE